MPDVPPSERRPLIGHSHRKRSPSRWIAALAVIIAVMILLPRLVELLEK